MAKFIPYKYNQSSLVMINFKYLHENEINAYIPDNQFRVRDPKFTDHKKSTLEHPGLKKDQ